jgi:ankyrin repeat protein
LLEAIKNGHDKIAELLVKEGAVLKLEDPGSFLCSIVVKGDSEFLKRILSNGGIDPNSRDYDHRTPLHVAASQGLYLMAKYLLDSGASVFSKDRWGNTPLDEGRMCGNINMIKLLEEYKSSQLSEFPDRGQEITDKMHPRKCTVFFFKSMGHKGEKRIRSRNVGPSNSRRTDRNSKRAVKDSKQ